MSPLRRAALYAAATAGMAALGAAAGAIIVALEERSTRRLGDGDETTTLAHPPSWRNGPFHPADEYKLPGEPLCGSGCHGCVPSRTFLGGAHYPTRHTPTVPRPAGATPPTPPAEATP